MASREKKQDIYFKKNSYFKKGIFTYWTQKEETDTIKKEEKESYFWKKKSKKARNKDLKKETLLSYWSKIGHFGKLLVKHWKKHELTTNWIWALHADAHDFETHRGPKDWILRKSFSSNIAHLSVVFLWLSGMHVHGCYFSNFNGWSIDPLNNVASAQVVWDIVGQDIMNGEMGSYFQGMAVTSGLFNLWRSWGIFTCVQLKYCAIISLFFVIITLYGAYWHMHGGFQTKFALQNKRNSILLHHTTFLLGMGSMSWGGHLIHISLPINRLLDCGIDPALIPWMHDIVSINRILYSGFGNTPLVDLSRFVPKGFSIITTKFSSTGSVYLQLTSIHHLMIGIVLLASSSVLFFLQHRVRKLWIGIGGLASHGTLSLSLTAFGSLSLVSSHHLVFMCSYPYLTYDYSAALSAFVHHMNIGCLLTVGAFSHYGIFMIREFEYNHKYFVIPQITCHRNIITGHLIYVNIWLAFHSFGLLVHNDTMQALSRPQDMFADNAIALKPLFAAWVQSLRVVGYDLQVLGNKVVVLTQELGSADFIIHHIHAFTIHCTILILFKGGLYARCSSLVSDKIDLGFRYPCDGPGRGGTCQISPWDHSFLGLFWMYNCLSVVIFHFFWKMQSDVWGNYSESQSISSAITHVSASDFSTNAITVNGWLRNFLWSFSTQVIQSYGTELADYGLIFLLSHFLWAFSLMFLFSGRGYWQELIEAIVYAHYKLKIVAKIQPRALSITHGRAAGLTHYLIGGIGTTNTFILARMISLN